MQSYKINCTILFQVQDRLEDPPSLPKPISSSSKDLVKDLSLRCSKSRNREAKELSELLNRPHLKALISTHDEVAEICERPKSAESEDLIVKTELSKLFPNGMTGEAYRMVGVRKKAGEPLGLTVNRTVTTGNLY